MAMTPEEKRQRERERKRRQRAAARERPKLAALPQIGPGAEGDGGTQGGTRGGTGAPTDDFDISNADAARAVLRGLTIPESAKWRAALVLQLARDLDAPMAIPQRAGLAARYTENLDALIAAARPRERDELDELRRAFYSGGTSGIDDDPEAPKRATRKKA